MCELHDLLKLTAGTHRLPRNSSEEQRTSSFFLLLVMSVCQGIRLHHIQNQQRFCYALPKSQMAKKQSFPSCRIISCVLVANVLFLAVQLQMEGSRIGLSAAASEGVKRPFSFWYSRPEFLTRNPKP